MLLQEEREQHEESSVVDDPPHVNRPLLQTLLVAGEAVDIFGHQQGLLGRRGLPHRFYGDHTPVTRVPVQADGLEGRPGAPLLPMKLRSEAGSRSRVRPAGQAISTVLCFMPPSPADWMSSEKPSRWLEVTTTWEKPLVRSAAMAAFRFWRSTRSGLRRRFWAAGALLQPLGPQAGDGGQSGTGCSGTGADLLCAFGVAAAAHEGSLQDGADDGEALPRLQLRGEGQQTRVLHLQLRVQLAQHQHLRPAETPAGRGRCRRSSGGSADTRKRPHLQFLVCSGTSSSRMRA